MEIAIILLIIMSIFLMTFIKHKDDLFIILISSIFLINWIADGLYLIPHSFTWIVELIIAILFINFLLPKIIYLKKINLGPFGKYILLLMLYSLIGSFIYFVNFSSILLGFRALFKYLFLYIILINSNLSQKSYKNIFKAWFFLMCIQPIVGSYQYFIQGKIADPVYGTLLSTGFQAILLIVFILFLIDLIDKKVINKFILYTIILLSIIIIPIFGEVKAFFYFLPIALIIKNFHYILKFELYRIVKFILPFIVGIYFLQSIFLSFWKVELFDFNSIDFSEFVFSQGTESASTTDNPQASLSISVSERFLVLGAVYNFLNQDKRKIFFGDGLGSNVFTYDSRNELTEQQIGGVIGQEQYLKKYTFGRVIQNIGLIGLIFFCLMLINIGIYSYRASRVTNDDFFKSIYQIIPAFSLLFIISIFYTDPFTDSISFTYWFLVGGLHFLSEVKERKVLKK